MRRHVGGGRGGGIRVVEVEQLKWRVEAEGTSQ